MDELTPHQLIMTSLATLRQAEALLQYPEDRIPATGIKKASGILEILVKEFIKNKDDTSDERPDEIADTFTYTPEILPLDNLLEPITPDTPAGNNIRLTGEVNELLSLVVNRSHAANFRPQYRTLREKAVELLTRRGKDLGVAVRLIEAAITDEEKSGFAAIADGLFLINGFLSTFWEGFYPEVVDDDYEARGNELKKFEELVLLRLSARYGQPHEFNPTFTDVYAAGREAAVFKTIFDQLAILDRTTYAKFQDQAPNLGELRSALGIFRRRIDAQFDTFKQRIKEEREENALRREKELNAEFDRISDDVDIQSTDEGTTAAPSGTIEPRDLSEAGKLLDSCAGFLVQNVPSDPIGYMIHREGRWFSRSFKLANVNPSAEQRQHIAEMFSAKQWSELLQNCEELFINGAHRWLDLQRYQVVAAEYLGPEYATVAAAIGNAASRYAITCKGVLEEKMDDGTPFASEETVQWLRETIAEPGGRGSGTGSSSSGDEFFSREIIKAEELAGRGRQGAALDLLLRRQHQACSRRERFLWQLVIAEFCVKINLTKVALPGIENMVETIDRLNLADWEDPEILLRVFRIGYDGYLSLGIDRAPEEKIDYFYRRICLYDPGHFLSSPEE